jgi:hypothetical protein
MKKVAALVVLSLLVACYRRAPRRPLSPEEQECQDIMNEADVRRGFRNGGNIAAGRPEETGPIDPCAVGCRIPRCGYPAH